MRLAGIEGGIECTRLAPLLSALADGEADAEALALLRPHLKTCLSCRARLREFRAAPGRVAAVVPAAAVLATYDGGPLRSLFESILGAAQHKAAVLGERLHATAELATGQKVAAVAASAAALAGGGTAVDQFANHEGPPLPSTEQVEAGPAEDVETQVDPGPPAPTAEQQPGTPQPAPAPVPEPGPPPPPPPPPDPAREFGPGAPPGQQASPPAAPGPATPTPAASPPAAPAPAAASPAPSPAAGAGEFAP